MPRLGKLLFLMCGSALAFAGCAKKNPPAMERPPAAVSVVAAVTKDVPVYLDEVGRCVAREVVSVQPELSGRITEIRFTDGAELKKGDLLFTIDPRPFVAEVDRASGELAAARARDGYASTDAVRAQRLLTDNAIAKRDYDRAQDAARESAANVLSA